MSDDAIRARIRELTDAINRNDWLYYVEAQPVISDAQYDKMYEELLELERLHPEFKDPNSPTLRVSGAPAEGFAQVRHDPPMKSLDKCYTKSALQQFDSFISKELGSGILWNYVVEPKIDGVSMSLLYENRRLVRAATRGNGETGDDVTRNIATIRSLPKVLPDDAPEKIEVRGEVFMTRDGFAELNRALDEAGKQTFMNPRNACAGSIKQLDPKIAASRPLDIVVYNAGGVGCDGFATHVEMIDKFKTWGFPVSPWRKLCSGINEAIAAIDELETLRHSFKFEIDGAVMKINECNLYGELGATAHSPRWARAYKYAPERVETILKDIIVQVGRTGVLTPVAELEPVELAGSIISRATLHNADLVASQDIRIGDHVWLVKAGDVIPAIDGVLTEKRGAGIVPYNFPSKCPVCGSDVIRREGEVAVRCVNPGCPAQLQRRLQHFASRDALDITMLGGKIADMLVERGIVRDVLDLFSLDYGALANLDVGEEGKTRVFGKNAESMHRAVDNARTKPLANWLFAMGIANVGVNIAKDIATEHESLYELPESPVLKNVIENDRKKGKERCILPIKAEAAKAVLEFFASPYGKSFLAKLKELGIEPKAEKKIAVASEGPLVGKGCVLTGTLSMPRGKYAALIEAAGGIVQSAVTSKTDFLIAGENTGANKTNKAKALGTMVIDETKLREMLSAAKVL